MVSKQHRIFYGSSYDRGLSYLLFMWPDVLAKFPDAELHICYGWQTFDAINRNNPERVTWKASIENLMTQKGITHHGRLGGKEFAEVRRSCGIWAYPTDFTEINCITALECQRDGAVPVTMAYAALNETVQSGVKIRGNIKDIAVQKKYLDALLELMGNEDRWKEEVAKGKEFAKDYSYENIAKKWIDVFTESVYQPSVSVITVTMREGFFNIMADNIAKQTYKPVEWIIVDDYAKDRSAIAKEYARKYDLNIVYIRGDKALGTYKRKHGLVRANNIGWKRAKGDLLVYVQDFIIMPENAIESMVMIHRHNPNALLAPVDISYYAKSPDTKNKKDWWNGDTDIFTKESWRNIRVKYEGLTKTDNPYDFEMNCAGVPSHIVKTLNGWWEFFDSGMGYDNTEFATRSLAHGYDIIIDDTIIVKAVDIGHHGLELNTKDWDRFMQGDLPTVRDEEIDKKVYAEAHRERTQEGGAEKVRNDNE